MTFALEDPDPEDALKPCMDVYKAKIQSYGTIDKLKLRIVVRGYLKNMDVMGETWYPTASLRTVKFLLADSARHKARFKQLDFIGAFLQAKVNRRFFVRLESKYSDFFPDYRHYFGRPLRLVRFMYGMTISGKLFADNLTDGFVKDAGFSQS